MATNPIVIISAKEAEAVDTQQYISPAAAHTIIDKFTATNTSAGSLTLSVNLVVSGGAVGDDDLIVKTKSISAGKSYLFPEIVGQTLGAGDFISTIASAAAGMTIRSSGRVVT